MPMQTNNLLPDFLSLVQLDDPDGHYKNEISENKYFNMPLEAIVTAEKKLKEPSGKNIAYFSMEYGLATSFYNTYSCDCEVKPENKIPENTVFSNFPLGDYFFSITRDNIIDLPIYSGGLGVLAGDTVKTMADYKLPAVGIGILWRSGYFRQRFWFKYGQVPEKMVWNPLNYPGLVPLKNTVTIQLKHETIRLKLWKYYVYSYKHDYAVPLVLLDADVEPNNDNVRRFTEQLYRSDNPWFKIMQRVILGFGGVAALRELGYSIDIHHLNEGHAVFAFIERARGMNEEEISKLSKGFVYTCHTPVEAGHDRFSQDELTHVLSDDDFNLASKFGKERSGLINLTLLSMNIASSVNAVSKQHRNVMLLQFPKYKDRIKYVTNGVHPYTWISDEFMKLFRNFPKAFGDIDSNPMSLSSAEDLKKTSDFRAQAWQAHQNNKAELCRTLEKWKIDKDALTICWARRVAAYKRPSLILFDVERLINIARNAGPLQIILAGKAHPNDNLGFTYINEMLDKVDKLGNVYDYLKIIILENYDIYLARMLTCGVDVWLNNPLPPFEASGTSGMKAILNGVLQVSTLDGWVVEAEDKGIGKIFGYRSEAGKISSEYDLHLNEDAGELYRTIEEMTNLYYKTNNKGKVDFGSGWIDMMINCISAGAFFNTYRMLDEYKRLVWGIP